MSNFKLDKEENMHNVQHTKFQGKIRTLFIYAVRLQVLILIVLLGAFVYLFTDTLCSQNELSRITSPDNKNDAVLVKSQCYLKSEDYTRLYFVPADRPIADYAMTEEHIEVLNSRWLSPQEFLLTYEKDGYEYELSIEIGK